MTSYLTADSLWWNGRLHAAAPSAPPSSAGVALRIADDGNTSLVHISDIPDSSAMRRLPGTLLPGLVDAHVHSGLVDLATVRAGGIAGVWDLGSTPATVAALTAVPGMPRIRYAGPFLIPPGGYPSDRSWAPRGSWREIYSPDDATAAVGEVVDCGATLVKVTAHAGGPLLPKATLAAVVSAAHTAGLPVVVHAEGPGTVAAAVESGADWLAHTPWTSRLDPGLIRACADRVGWISTLDIHGWGEPTPELTTALGNLRDFLAAGGRVRYGTDLGNGPLPPAVNRREIRNLQAAGLTPDDILLAMTGDDVTWVPGGLDLDPARFAGSLATARVLDDRVRPRGTGAA
ncbi:amidohydrolase [Actinoplanes solisilvae]|uniref:amidohydrolase n=1 Tax=Actinoplanes solisilvae TaxID=2486853 RepID=UPI000FD9A5C1|nr:amidohydrolase [Actinoplanes solisilvae]